MFNDRQSGKPNLNAFRLDIAELNELIDAEGHKRGGVAGTTDLMIGKAKSSLPQMSCQFIETPQSRFCLLHVTKDSDSRTTKEDLPYLGELLALMKDDPKFVDATILIPVSQKELKLKHGANIVLVAVDFTLKTMEVHDSQHAAPFRADALADIAKQNALTCKYYDYGAQKDDSLCGYYVHQYMRSILDLDITKYVKVTLKQEGDHLALVANGMAYTNKDDYMNRNIPGRMSGLENSTDSIYPL